MPRFDPHPQRRPALISGASSGIGAATARALAAAGHPVALGARRLQECEKIAAAVREEGGEAIAAHLDVGERGSVRDFVAAAEEALGPPEVLVSGAGDIEAAQVHEQDPDEFRDQVDVHLVGAQRLVHEVVPAMVRRQRGDVVFFGSDVTRAHRPRMGAYVPAKSGLEAMARTMRMELEGTGVRASVVRPGPTESGMGGGWDDEVTVAVLEDWIRWGLARHSYFLRPSDVASAVTTIVSAPRGAHFPLIEVEPEAPLTKGGDAGV